MKSILLAICGSLCLSTVAYSQVKVGDNPTTLAPNTVFQVEKGGRSMVVNSLGNVGIGTLTPVRTLHVESNVSGLTGANEILSQNQVGWAGLHTRVIHNGTEYPYILGSRARGTVAAPTYSQTGDILMSLIGRDAVNAYDFAGSGIYALASQNMSATAKGSNLMFNTTPNNTTSSITRMVIDHDGKVGLGTTAPREAISMGSDFHIHNGGWKALYSNMSYVTTGSGAIYQKTSGRRASFISIANTTVGGFSEGSIVFATETGATPAVAGADVSAAVPLAMYIDGSTGNVGINAFNAGQKLVVGGIVYATSYTTPSDSRFKENIRPLGNALAMVGRMRGVTYTHTAQAIKDRNVKAGNQIGFIAQELETVYPEFVITNTDGYKAVDYARLTPVLVEAIKEQQAQIDALKTQASKVASLEAEMASIKAMLQSANTPVPLNSGK